MMVLWICCLWAVASTIVAMLPMRYQYVPVVALLMLAPALIAWVALSVHWAAAAFGLFALLSMYRNPLRYFLACARGQRPEIPK